MKLLHKEVKNLKIVKNFQKEAKIRNKAKFPKKKKPQEETKAIKAQKEKVLNARIKQKERKK